MWNIFLKHILCSNVLNLFYYFLLFCILKPITLPRGKRSQGVFQKCILSRISIFLLLVFSGEIHLTQNTLGLVTWRCLSESLGGRGKRDSTYCYPALFKLLWEHELIAGGAVSQHLGQHLIYGRTSLCVCWMTKWMNDGLPAPKLGLSFQ